MSIEQLTNRTQVPDIALEVSKNPDWAEIEQAIGTALPSDYKDFVETFGTGRIGDFVSVHNPFSQLSLTNLESMIEYTCMVLQAILETPGRSLPFGIHPDSPGLLSWGKDDNGTDYYWYTDGAPDDWPCVVLELQGKKWQRFDMPMTDFLAQAFAGELICDLWPDDVAVSNGLITFDSFDDC